MIPSLDSAYWVTPIDTVTDLGSALWNYNQTIDAIKISVTQWN